MAEKLTPAQKEAVENRGGHLLVSAAAGSGKTKVLVDRLMRYIQDPVDPANIDDFLIITYTKAAAAELRGKIASKLTQQLAIEPENRHLQRQLQRLYLAKISTVHAFCGDILREYAYKLQLSADFRMIDESEAKQLRASVMNDLLERAYESADQDPCFCAFIDSQGFGRNDSAVPAIIEQVYDKSRCHLRPEKYLAKCVCLSQMDSLSDVSQSVYGQFLLSSLGSYLDLQLQALDAAVTLAASEPGMEKPHALLLETAAQIRSLRDAKTWDEAVSLKDIHFGTLRFSKKGGETEAAARIKAMRDACKKGVAKITRRLTDTSAGIMEDMGRSGMALQGLVSLVEQFTKEYSKGKNRRHCLDFSDLEHCMLDLLLGRSRSGPTAAAKEIGSRFREVLVDEYQDSNAVQDAIFDALTRERNNCFLVGDVKQSIYQFRLADPGIFLEKYHRFVPAEEAVPGEGRKIMLSHNFRSGGAVLEAANDVFRLCMSETVGGMKYGDAEALREGISHVPLGEPEVELAAIEVQDDTYAEEAVYVADRISELLSGEHYIRQGESLRRITAQDIAILLRSPNSVGEHYRQALEARDIRCSTGKQSDLLESSEIATLSSLLEIVDNPRQDIPLIAALTSPVFGFTANDLAKIRSGKRHCSFFDALQQDADSKTHSFLDTLNHLRAASRIGSICYLLQEIIVSTRLDNVYAAMDAGEQRLENLNRFFRLASGYEASGRRDLGSFLEYLHSLQEQGVPGEDGSASGAVQLLSIHKSKGLEYPVVFLCGLSRAFNTESQREAVLCHKELGLGLSTVDSENRVRYPTIAKQAIAEQIQAQSISEEMRVLYVAMTRARDRLIMTYASDDLQEKIQDLLLRMQGTPTELLCMDVNHPGMWILLAALRRSEAGELFRLAGCSGPSAVSQHPWRISVVKAATGAVNRVNQDPISDEKICSLNIEMLRQIISFQYPHEVATTTPSKQTATELKGRQKDMEAAQMAQQQFKTVHKWRSASFAGEQAVNRSVDYGNAMHKAMAYVHYEACGDENGVLAELERLHAEGCLSPRELELIDGKKISSFFLSDLGFRLRSGSTLLREFKFSILQDAESLDGEQILLQGVVDCAMVEQDGIILVDFKTDYITGENLSAKVSAYTPQVNTYAQALKRIFHLPVKEKYLYFFHSGELVPVI